MSQAYTLEPLTDPQAVATLARTIYQDPANREATGWMHEEDKEEAIGSLVDLWKRRLAGGWTIYRVKAAGRTIGLAGYGPTDDPDGPPGLGVYLLDRGKGLGTALAQEMVDRARREGADAMETVAHARNPASHRMLKKAGFEPAGPCTADWARASGEAWLIFRRPL